jgi:hypothetical protein
LVGEPTMTFLTGWRTALAADLMVEPEPPSPPSPKPSATAKLIAGAPQQLAPIAKCECTGTRDLASLQTTRAGS